MNNYSLEPLPSRPTLLGSRVLRSGCLVLVLAGSAGAAGLQAGAQAHGTARVSTCAWIMAGLCAAASYVLGSDDPAAAAGFDPNPRCPVPPASSLVLEAGLSPGHCRLDGLDLPAGDPEQAAWDGHDPDGDEESRQILQRATARCNAVERRITTALNRIQAQPELEALILEHFHHQVHGCAAELSREHERRSQSVWALIEADAPGDTPSKLKRALAESLSGMDRSLGRLQAMRARMAFMMMPPGERRAYPSPIPQLPSGPLADR